MSATTEEFIEAASICELSSETQTILQTTIKKFPDRLLRYNLTQQIPCHFLTTMQKWSISKEPNSNSTNVCCMIDCCQCCKNASKRRSKLQTRSLVAQKPGRSLPRSFRFPFAASDHGVRGQPVASTQTLNRKKLIQCSQTASPGPRDQSAQTTHRASRCHRSVLVSHFDGVQKWPKQHPNE